LFFESFYSHSNESLLCAPSITYRRMQFVASDMQFGDERGFVLCSLFITVMSNAGYARLKLSWHNYW